MSDADDIDEANLETLFSLVCANNHSAAGVNLAPKRVVRFLGQGMVDSKKDSGFTSETSRPKRVWGIRADLHCGKPV